MRLLLLTTLLCAALPVSLLHAQSRVSEGTLLLPFYEEGPPNPNAPFDQYSTTRFNYPYVLRDNLLSRKADHVFRAIFLENEYLKCTVLPDVGGHVYTCRNKINNVPMFYENPSIKEAAIGMRGGWAAFGLEFNFPVSHNWMTVSPVDFAYSQDKDGSASVVISNIDRVYAMQWTVRLVLRPDSTLLEQQVSLNNRSDVRHRFYWWSNGGVQAWDDTRIAYPMRYSAAHGFADVDRWPVDSSRTDLSLLKNHTNGPVSRFVHASREPFMGIWNPHTNAGIAHFADYAELPAKKIWSWGSDADGLDWRKALSDNDSAYVEVQAGLFRNQETYAFLQPRQTIHFTEYWMPLHELGGLSRANLAGAVYLARTGGKLMISLNVNSRLHSATIRLLDGDRVLRTAKADLVPEHTWTEQVAVPDQDHAYTFELSDSKANVLLAQTEGKYDWAPDSEVHTGPQPPAVIPDPSNRSEGDWLEVGHDDELNGRLLIAAANYQEGLRKYPGAQSLTIAAGRLSAALFQYDRAVILLSAAQARDTSNAEISYYLGLAQDGLGDIPHARLAYEAAARSPEMHARASLRLGEMAARRGDLDDAERWLLEAHHAAPDDLRTVEELAAIYAAKGRKEEAHILAAEWYTRYPTSYFLAEELNAPQMHHLAADPERVLNVAGEYMGLGRYASALTVLSRSYPSVPSAEMEPGALAPSENPLVVYYRAFCLKQLGRPYQEQAKLASLLSINYVFPSGAQTATVLRAELLDRPEDATAHYLLGMLQFSTGMVKEAEAHWQSAHDLHAVLPGLDANRGYARLSIDNDPEGAIAAFREGIRNDPSNEGIYIGIDQALNVLHRPASEFIDAMAQYPDKTRLRSKLVYELALHLAEAGRFSAADDLLRDRFFPREEGGTNVRQVWIEIELERLGTLARSKQCDAANKSLVALNQPRPGLVFTQDGLEPIIAQPRAQYQIAMIDRACGNQDAAFRIFHHLAESKGDEDLVYKDKAASLLPGYDAPQWRKRLEIALVQSERGSLTNSYAMFNKAMLQQRLGKSRESRETFRAVFIMPDQKLSYHLARSFEASETRK
jgi:tetratricopeptide (TPR) repeat protein